MILYSVNDFNFSKQRGLERPYHKLVKTTPKPKATKNSNGELVGPPPPPPPPEDVVAAGAASVVESGCMLVTVLVAVLLGMDMLMPSLAVKSDMMGFAPPL